MGFTIITPALNAERWIADTVASVVAQTRDDWEMVIIDNGSTDATAARVEPFLDDRRIRLIRAGENRPPAVWRNELAEEAAGRYIVMLDADDKLLPDFLAAVGEVLDARPEVAVVSPDALLIGGRDGHPLPGTLMGSSWWRKLPDLHEKGMLEALLDRVFLYAGSAVRRSDFLAVGGLAPDLFSCMDWDLWIRLAAAGREIVVIDEPHAVYRVHGGSLSRPTHDRTSERFARNIALMLERSIERLDLTPSQRATAERTRTQALRNADMAAARASLIEGDVAAARRAGLAALRGRPSMRTVTIAGLLVISPGALRRLHVRRLERAAEIGSAIGFRPESPARALLRRIAGRS